MHIHKPKPLYSLREFLGELGIIVLGIPSRWGQSRRSSATATKILTADDDRAVARKLVAMLAGPNQHALCATTPQAVTDKVEITL